jgi:hypothetical protein
MADDNALQALRCDREGSRATAAFAVQLLHIAPNIT